MDEGSPPRVKEPLPSRLERLQDKTLRVWHMEGAHLVSERDLKRDGAKETDSSPQRQSIHLH